MDGRRTALRVACDLVRNDYPHTLEFGVAGGASLKIIRGLISGDIFGFDTFTGLPDDWVTANNEVVQPKGEFNENGKPPSIDGVNFYVGLFNETIPLYRKIAQPIRLLHIDCDLYASTKDVLNGVGDLLLNGSIIVFDEWQYYYKRRRRRDHEARAFLEWIEQTGRKYQFIDVRRPRNYPVDQKVIRMLD